MWKEFLPGYEISIDGEVRNIKTKKLIKPFLNKGYLHIRIKNRNFSALLHRLILINFNPIPNSSNYVINHIDGDRKNNKLSNLEWCTQKQNLYHSKNITKNGAVISRQKILNLYEKNKSSSLEDFVKIIISECR